MKTHSTMAGVFSSALFLGIAIACASAASDEAPRNLLGKIDFPNSGAAAAQSDFIEGVLYLHNFEYAEASAAFKRAQAVDPDFALAYWGEAMTFNQPLWARQSTSNARDSLKRLGRTAEERAAKAPTQREKDYLAAVEILFGMTDASMRLPKHDRDVLYRDQLRRVHEAYPDDHEATAFYGLSILGAGSEDRDYATYMRAAAVLTEVWDANRMHPGGAHYLIHAYDDPIHAPLGLPMARVYSKIAPAAAHAQHMTSHIFVAMGMWDDLVAANETAVGIELRSAEKSGATPEASHYLYWLEYGYLQQGRIEKARELVEAARERLNHNPTQTAKLYYGAMYARYQFDAGDLPNELSPPLDAEILSPHYHFAQAFAAIEHRNFDEAQKHAQNIHAISEGNPEVTLDPAVVDVLNKELQAMTALSRSEPDSAVTMLRKACEDSDALPIRYGPPQMTKPAYELLGDVLILRGKPAEAIAAYERQLESTPLRANTLLGLARAAVAAGENAKAADAYRQLAGIWHAADPAARGYAEVMAATKPSH